MDSGTDKQSVIQRLSGGRFGGSIKYCSDLCGGARSLVHSVHRQIFSVSGLLRNVELPSVPSLRELTDQEEPPQSPRSVKGCHLQT